MPNRDRSQNSRSRQKIGNAPPCCRCNGINARCKFCACAKAGRACTCCLPARNGLCSNVTAHIPVSNVSQSTLTTSSQPIPQTTTLSSDSQQLSSSQPILRQLHVFSSPVPSSCSPTPLQTPMPSFHSPSSSGGNTADAAARFDGQSPWGCLETRRFQVLSSSGAMP